MSFASTTDLADRQISLDEPGPGLCACTAEGDPDAGVTIGPDGVVVTVAPAAWASETAALRPPPEGAKRPSA